MDDPFRAVIRRVIVAAIVFVASIADGGTVVNDGSLGSAAVTHSGNIFTIGPASGRQVGTNLFQSLSTLNLDQGETAQFTGPSSIQNVITRVTGGASSIDGTLSCTIPNANFLLINPAGVAFGPDAALNVSGSFVVTTADVVKLADGQSFTAVPGPTDATLTTAAPAAFGFLSASPAALTVNGSTLSVPAGQCLSAIGGAVTISDGQLSAPGGRITIASANSTGTVTLNTSDPTSTLQTSSFSSLGPISIVSGAIVSADGVSGAGGRIEMQGDSLTLTNAQISAQTTGPGQGAGIDLNLRGSLTSTDSSVVTGTNSSGTAGDLSIEAGAMSISGRDANSQSFDADSTAGVSGNAGNLSVTAASLSLADTAFLGASTNGAGAGRNVNVTVAGAITIDGGTPTVISGILADSNLATPGGGNGGDVTVSAGTLSVTNARISSNTFGTGNGGDVQVTVTGGITLDGGVPTVAAGILADSSLATQGGGNCGVVTVNAGTLSITNGAEIGTNTFGPGAGGDVNVNVPGAITITGTDAEGDPSNIAAVSDLTTPGGGNSGNVTVNAGTLSITNAAEIAASTFGAGKGGDVRVAVSAGTLSITNGAEISADTYGTGAGGDVHVAVAKGTTLDGGTPTDASGIFADSNLATPGGGNGGNVAVNAETLSITNGAEISTDTFGAGAGGDVHVTVATGTTLDGGTSTAASGIYAQSELAGPGGGNGGNVTVNAETLSITNAAEIAASTFGAGKGGDVHVTASAGITLDGGTPTAPSGIFAGSDLATPDGGNGGDVTVHAGTLSITNGAEIAASTFGAGRGGDVHVTVAGGITVDGGTPMDDSGIFADSDLATPGGGNGGDVTVHAGTLSVTNGADIDASTYGTGAGGDTYVNVAGLMALGGGAFVSSETDLKTGGGRSGDVRVSAGSLTLDSGSAIETDTYGSGAAGDVAVTVVGQLVISDNSYISSQSNNKNNGPSGSVSVSAAQLTLESGGDIDADTFSSSAAGDVVVTVTGSMSVTGDESYVSSQGGYTNTSIGGPAGSVTIRAGTLMLEAGGEIETDAYGAGDAGDVTIIVPGQLTLNSSASIGSTTSLSAPGGGKGGDVNVTAASLLVEGGASIGASTFGSGAGGGVNLFCGSLTVDTGAGVGSTSSGTGSAGSLLVQSSGPITLNKGLASVQSFHSSGGDVNLIAGGDIELFNSAVSAEAALSGGNISLNSAGLIYLSGSVITGEAGSTGIPGQNGGVITLDPRLVILNNSVINGLASGRDVLVTIGADELVVSTDSLILTNDVAFTVDTNVSAALVSLPQAQFGGSAELEPTCAMESGADMSSFIVTGRGGLPPTPGGWLPSPNSDGEQH
jgi:filamentous hemagglutinin family protein